MNIHELTASYEKRIDELNDYLQSQGDGIALKSYDMISFVDATLIQLKKTLEDLKHLK